MFLLIGYDLPVIPIISLSLSRLKFGLWTMNVILLPVPLTAISISEMEIPQ